MTQGDQFEGFAVTDPKNFTDVTKIKFTPKTFEEYDIDVKIHACGVCGSDVHTASGAWGEVMLPVIVGHEIIGEVVKVGSKVTTVKNGDRVGVGAQVWACLKCDVCKSGEETYCPHLINTYNDKYPDGSISYGGYLSHIRVHEYFTFKIPEKLSSENAAPMLCAGITTYAPLKKNTRPGMKVGIVGIGGLGHFAIMWARALGCEVFSFSRTDSKKKTALELGADHFVDTTAKDWNKDLQFKLDLILSCASSSKDFSIGEYTSMLTIGGKFISAGIPEAPFSVNPVDLLKNACYLGSSHLGNRQEMIEMLNLAAEKNVTCWNETIPISKAGIKEALEKNCQNKVRYRITLTDYDKQFE